MRGGGRCEVVIVAGVCQRPGVEFSRVGADGCGGGGGGSCGQDRRYLICKQSTGILKIFEIF